MGERLLEGQDCSSVGTSGLSEKGLFEFPWVLGVLGAGLSSDRLSLA